MSLNFICIGLPGSGKTTIMSLFSEYTQDSPVFTMDDQIKIRLNRLLTEPYIREKLTKAQTDDPVVNALCLRWSEKHDLELVVSAFLREGYEKHSSAVMKLLGEPCWRELEAAIAVDFLKNQKGCLFDLGSSQPLDAVVQQACLESGIKFIFLKADHETICQHLSVPQKDGRPRWQQISNYAAEGENGWKALALKHRALRESKYEEIAYKTVDVSNKSIDEVLLEIKAIVAINNLESFSDLSLDSMDSDVHDNAKVIINKHSSAEPENVSELPRFEKSSPRKHY